MKKNLVLPLPIGLTELNELHLCDPNVGEGWNVTHLSTTEVC